MLRRDRADRHRDRLPCGQGLDGVKTRTVSSSAQWILPGTACPPAVTAERCCGAARSIAWVKRTDRSRLRSTRPSRRAAGSGRRPGALSCRTASDRGERRRRRRRGRRRRQAVVDVRPQRRAAGWNAYRASAVGRAARADDAGGRRVEPDRGLDRGRVDGLGEGHDGTRRQRDVRRRAARSRRPCPSSRHASGKRRGRVAPAAARSGEGPGLDGDGVQDVRRPSGVAGAIVRLVPSGPRRGRPRSRVDGQRRRDRRRVHRRAEPDRDGFVRPRSVATVVSKAAWVSGRIGDGGGRHGRRRPTGREDTEAEEDRQAETTPTRSVARASQQGAEHDRDEDGTASSAMAA